MILLQSNRHPNSNDHDISLRVSVYKNGNLLLKDGKVTCQDQRLVICGDDNKLIKVIHRKMTRYACSIKRKKGYRTTEDSKDAIDVDQGGIKYEINGEDSCQDILKEPFFYSIELYLVTFHWYALVITDGTNVTSMARLHQLWTRFTGCFDFVNEEAIQSRVDSHINMLDSAIMDDYRRQGIDVNSNSATSVWRLSHVNQSFAICSTYPQIIAVPSSISDTVLGHVAKFRTKGRFPILSFLSSSGAAIARSSQPLVGLKIKRSIQDEKLVEAIRQSSPSQKLLLVDARPTANAYANAVTGAGVEPLYNYKHCERIFVSIPNIHALRETAEAMLKESIKSKPNSALDWTRIAKATGWIEHVQTILKGVHRIIQAVNQEHKSVLIHCSDGWDRTAQLTTLASICLDSFYRTCKGLEVLINREWVMTGHRLDTRSHVSLYTTEIDLEIDEIDDVHENLGLNLVYESRWASHNQDINNPSSLIGRLVFGENSTKSLNNAHRRPNSDQVAPIFMLFLDCLGQLIRTYPHAFDFEVEILDQLLTQLYTKRWADCERDRYTNGAMPRFSVKQMMESKVEMTQTGVLETIDDALVMQEYSFTFDG